MPDLMGCCGKGQRCFLLLFARCSVGAGGVRLPPGEWDRLACQMGGTLPSDSPFLLSWFVRFTTG